MVWLGQDDNETVLVIELLEYIAMFSVQALQELELKDLERADRKVPRHFFFQSHCGRSQRHLKALIQPLLKEWFTRVWVVQEVAVAKQPLVLCGSHSISWDHIAHASGRVPMWISIKILSEDVESAVDMTVRAANSHNINRIRESHLAGQCNMWTTLRCIFDFNATNHRDNIYAALGLSPPNLARHLHPDYRLSVEQIYIQATREFIRETKIYIYWP